MNLIKELTSMKEAKVKYQPSIYVAREEGEDAKDFVRRVLKDPRLLSSDQRHSLEQDLKQYSPFDSKLKGIWLEQPPK